LEAVEGQFTTQPSLTVASVGAVLGAGAAEEILWKLDKEIMHKIVDYATKNLKAK
jgi:hypothetical protein